MTEGVARIKCGLARTLSLGNLDAKRDWGFAGDYVEAMYLMLQGNTPDDYVIATGKTHTVKDFVMRAAEALGFELEWEGEGTDTRGIDKKSGKTIVGVSKEFYRPAEVDILIGDPSKAERQLGWKAKTDLSELVAMMAKADYDRVKSDSLRF